MSEQARTAALVTLIGLVIAVVVALAPAQAEPEPAPLRWDDIPVCLDCGRANA